MTEEKNMLENRTKELRYFNFEPSSNWNGIRLEFWWITLMDQLQAMQLLNRFGHKTYRLDEFGVPEFATFRQK